MTTEADSAPISADGGAQQPTEATTDLQADAAGQGDQTQQADTQASKGDTNKAEGAPDAYEFTAPEGVALEPAVIDAFSAAAKAANLPQDAAQKILGEVAPVMAAKQREAVEAVRTQWADEALADKDFGGDKLPESLATAQRALKEFGDESLTAFLDESGLGNHPGVIRMLWKVGNAISEDRFVSGGVSTNQPSAQRLYAASNMNP